MQLASGPSTFLRATREKRVHEQLRTCCLPRKISRDLGGLQFGLVVIKCASHQSNLVGMAAVCGDKAKTPTENCPVNAARSRLFEDLSDGLEWVFGRLLIAHASLVHYGRRCASRRRSIQQGLSVT